MNGVTVNGTAFTGQTINSFSSDTGIWCVGNATSAYGSYKALQLAIENDASFPLTVEVTASGYNKLTMEVAKTTVSYNDVYTATVKTPEVEPSTPQRSRKRIRMHQPILRYRHPSAMTLT